MDDTFTEPWPEDDDTIGGAYNHDKDGSDEDCEYYNPDRFYKKVQEEPASSALVDFAKVLQTPSTRTSSHFCRNWPVPVARSLDNCRKIQSGRHMTGAMCHSPRESRRRRRLHQAPKKDWRRRWHAFGRAD